MLRIQKPMSDGLRLGELLIGAGILTRDAVEAALTLAFASNYPLVAYWYQPVNCKISKWTVM